jgi:TusA-related sulfurtransferase
MSVDSQSTITHAPDFINLSEKLSGAEQQNINNLLALLSANDIDSNNEADAKQSSINIIRFVDGRGLACPMPLLKTKVALRDVATGESLYVVATDANSQADIAAFCRQSKQTDTTNRLLLTINSVTNQQTADSTSSQRFDTIYHFIITKTDSN